MSEKIKLSRAVVVEGRYDKIKLASLIDGVILVTNGFGIYNDKELCKTIRYYAQTCGLIVLTDSDSAGRQIRAHIKSILPKELHSKVASVHIPQIPGKERRKDHPSKEGTLGVEGMSAETLRCLLKEFEDEKNRPGEIVTKNDLYMLGLTGGADCVKKRSELAKKLGFPQGLSVNALLDLINTLYTKEEFISAVQRL